MPSYSYSPKITIDAGFAPRDDVRFVAQAERVLERELGFEKRVFGFFEPFVVLCVSGLYKVREAGRA